MRKTIRAKLVGVSNYPDAVARLTPGTHVSVVHEPDNQHDPNAFRVVIDGDTVGYLSKDIAKRLIDKDQQRSFEAVVDDVTTYEEKTVGGFVVFDTDAGYYTQTNKETDKMSRFRLDDEVTAQGAEGWESNRESRIRAYRLPTGRPITVIPITDYQTAAQDGGWISIREVKAFGGIKVGSDIVDIPGRLLTFAVQDFVVVTGKDGSKKRRYVEDPLLGRLLPSKFETRRPRNATDDWQPPRHTRPKDITYFNCVYIDGQLESGERAKYNPKPGDHILISMATSWYEDWKRLIERDRKKFKDYSPAGRRWTLKITGSFDAGNLALEADDDMDGPMIPLPDPVNLDDWAESNRAEIDAWVAAMDGISTAVFPDEVPDDIEEQGDPATDAYEEAIEASADAQSGHDWTEEIPARIKKALLEINVKVKPTAKPDELYALARENEEELLKHMGLAVA